MKFQKTKSINKILLALMVDLGESVVEFGVLWKALSTHYGSAYGRGGSVYVAELKQLQRQADLRRKVYELTRRRYIKVRRQGKKILMTLTDKGYTAAFVNQLRRQPSHQRGWQTVVVFDIPEQLTGVRKQFRTLLKNGGFKQLQRSVWVSGRDTLVMMANFVKRNKIQRWVKVFYATNFI